MQGEEDKPAQSRGEEFLQLFKKGAEFTQDLLRENERLRYRVLELEEGMAHGPGGAELSEKRELAARVEQLEREKEEILGRVRQVEAQNRDFAARYGEIEEEHNNLANLYIASFQLHSTLDFQEVLQVITEIIINLIGAETFAIMLLDAKSSEIRAVAAEGVACEEIPQVVVGRGLIGEVAASGESYFAPDLAGYRRDLASPVACIPLKIKDHVIGVLAIYELLKQKEAFAPVDFELFALLAGHAATAIFSARMYSDSERKLSTFQGFIELLTS